MLRHIKNLSEHEKEEENYYKPANVSNNYTEWSNNYIEYESNGDRSETLSVKEYLNEISPYLKDIINSLKKSVCHMENLKHLSRIYLSLPHVT